METAISTESLNFFYDGTQILKDINLNILKGRFVSVVGPSGCGKSTLLLLLARMLSPASGSITVESDNVGLIFQEYNRVLLPWRTVLDNAALYLELLGAGKSERYEIIKNYLALVGLNGFEKLYPHQLSGGMKQRVQIARVLSTQPQILLLDEPFGSLDSQTKESMQDELLNIFYKEKGLTALFVTHDIEEATFLSDEVVILGRRPSVVVGKLDVGIPHPRDAETRFSDRFQQIKHEIWKSLRSIGAN
ncbi:MAG: hypothetical protein AUJ07_04580 [Crenarchaeota archaeon 13_1_40CM_3_53_5]|nr:MAG: hypothetical protein AUJ07_04580 [Crenarchaeota archaeon 13_1_40CM_3_53_5]